MTTLAGMVAIPSCNAAGLRTELSTLNPVRLRSDPQSRALRATAAEPVGVRSSYGRALGRPSSADDENSREMRTLIEDSGWSADWDEHLPASQEDLTAALACSDTEATWADTAEDHTAYPINCVSWYEAFAFCIWDGGRLPTEAQWECAAGGGNQHREYAGGEDSPIELLANWADGATSPLVAVGSTPDGNGRWGHRDLTGSLWEWNLDWHQTYASSCDNCAAVAGDATARVARGGAYLNSGEQLQTSHRTFHDPAARFPYVGVRCARSE